VEEIAKPSKPAALHFVSSSLRLFVSFLAIHVVLLYRAILRPFLGGHCRFTPTCSQYAIDAINQYGPWRGGIKAIRRISRCHPLGGKGYDPA